MTDLDGRNSSLTDKPQDRVINGIVLIVGFCIVAPLLDVFAKLASSQIPIAQIMTFRFLVQALLILPIFWVMKYSVKFSPTLVPRLLLRKVFLIIATWCFMSAIKAMPIADALVIVFAVPYILFIMGKLLFKETIGIRRIAASITGLLGVLFVIQPSFSNFGVFAFYPFGNALSFALDMLVTPNLSKHMDSVPLQLHKAVFGSIICLAGLICGPLFAVVQLKYIKPLGIYSI